MSSPFYSGLKFGLGLATAFFVAVVLVGIFAKNDKDDTDPPGGRSGVILVTDHKTGLQYLRAPGGGITPRLTVDGEHMREESE